MPPSLPMMPSGMPRALFHITSVANVKPWPSHTYRNGHDPLRFCCSSTSASVPG